MKKLLSVILALTLVLGLTACGGNAAEETVNTVGVDMPGSALELLENIWVDYAEEEKFPIIGGSMSAPVDNAPGSFDLTDEGLSYLLLVPAEQQGSITEAASMIHAMNTNTFTCAAFKLAEGTDADAFAEAMRQAVQGNQWMCGFPETLHIGNFGDTYILVAFGVNDAMNPFNEHLAAVCPYSEVVVNEVIG